MNILIVYAHPSKKSYTFEILDHLKNELAAQHWNVEISDLYAINFQSDMTKEEYEREGFVKTEMPIPDDVQQEHQKIERADCIIFLYPLWWSDCPAKLKGWFDRVYSVGYAYGKTGNAHEMKLVDQGLVICTAGHPNQLLTEIGIAESMRNIMLDDRLGNRFKNKEMIILGGTLQLEQVRELHKAKVKALISTLKFDEGKRS